MVNPVGKNESLSKSSSLYESVTEVDGQACIEQCQACVEPYGQPFGKEIKGSFINGLTAVHLLLENLN